MNVDNINFRAKDVIQFGIYVIPLFAFFLGMSAKVERATEALEELKAERKEATVDSKASSIIIQNEIKTLTVRAELNRQSIEIMKADIEILKRKYLNN
jgi:uncharacterized protein related to proFAR isomerase